MKKINENIKQSLQKISEALGKDAYFDEAKSWADDMYASVSASRNRYKLGFILCSILIFLLVILISFLVPAQHLEPLIINHYSDGTTSVAPIKKNYKPSTQAELESDIVRYVSAREGYDFESFDKNYKLVAVMSSGSVFNKYRSEQSIANKNSPINQLKNKSFRQVDVRNVLIIDLKSKNKKSNNHHKNLAEVTYEVTTHNMSTGRTKTKPYKSLISWTYKGMPESPNLRWLNWNGFTITKFSKSQTNVGA